MIGRLGGKRVVVRVGAGLAVTTVSLAACSSSSGVDAHGSLRVAGDSSPAGEGLGHVPVGKPYMVLTFSVCTVGAPVTVTAAKLNNPRGLKLVDWGWEVAQGGVADPQRGLVTRLGEGFTHRPINVKCSSRHGALVAVSLERTGPGAGTVTSYTLRYGGGSLVVPFGVAVCPSKCSQQALAAAGN